MKIHLILLLVTMHICAHAQTGPAKAALNSQSLPDGIYLNLQQLKDRQPGITVQQLQMRNEKKISPRQWFRQDSLIYTHPNGNKTSISAREIYAFADDGDVFIQRKEFAHKVTILGSLCYFTETYPVRNAPLSPVTLDLSRDVVPRMLDLKTGEFLPYTTATMEIFLEANDPALYADYMGLENQKQKRQLLIRYIEKYNERHPLVNETGL